MSDSPSNAIASPIQFASPISLSLVFSTVLLLLTSCGKPSGSETASAPSASPSPNSSPTLTTPALSPSPSVVASSPNPTANFLLSAQQVGAARLGMTLGELKQVLGAEVQFAVVSPFIVDFDAIAVQKEGKALYYILYLKGQTFADSDVIQGILTDNPNFKTTEGIGPGSSLTKAEQAYGKATLSYNTENESREYVRFERQPSPNLSFSTGTGTQELAGIYPSPDSTYNETQSFQEDARIRSVLVVCLSEGCAPPSPSPAAPSPTPSP